MTTSETHDQLITHTLFLVRGFPTSLNTASDGSWNQALKWINNCLSHPLCNPVQTANLQDKRPARLVAVGTIGETYVRICETSRDGCTKEPYMTLSHCWGKKGVPIRLLEENYAGFLNGIQLGELPNTFRDAIELTRKLEIPYIWIDSLCIIQDSPGDKDWIRESAKMQEIYRNSFLNLAAAASFDSNGGLFNRRYPLSVVPWSVRVAENVYLTKKYTSEYPGIRAQKKLILYTRGWVLQEQLLARRTLVFGQDELHWECSTCQASESFPDSHEYSTDEVPYNIFRPGWENLLKGKPVDSDRQKAWNRLISTYSRRSLTKPSDRLMAISGLAEHLSSRWSGITYLAGLWSYRLIHELLWHCGSCSQRNMEIAPSWSWASLQERQSIGPSGITMCEDLGWLDVLAEVLEAKVTPKARTSPFGPVACGGSIRLRSPVIRARITIEDKRHRRYNLALEDNCNLDTLILQDVDVKWDDIDDAKADMKDAYFAPFEIQAYDKHDLATLHGLVLLKTAVHLLPCKTQLRRAGYFTRYDDGVSSDNDSENSCHDDGSDSGRDDASDESFQGGMDNNSEDASVTSSKDHELRWERSFRKRKKQGLFRNFNSWFAEKIGDGLEERMNYLKKDPYVNGPPLNTTLENRYLTEPGKEFLPDFSKFFEAIARVAQNNKANGTPDPVLGMGEGNGYYTYEIV